jgi:hypothetical protein
LEVGEVAVFAPAAGDGADAFTAVLGGGGLAVVVVAAVAADVDFEATLGMADMFAPRVLLWRGNCGLAAGLEEEDDEDLCVLDFRVALAPSFSPGLVEEEERR